MDNKVTMEISMVGEGNNRMRSGVTSIISMSHHLYGEI